MYVGYLLDKESGMYHQGPVRRSSINLPPQNFVSTPQYPDFSGYHHVPNMETHTPSAGSWGPSYGAPRADWGAYSLGPPNTIPTPMNNSSPGQVPYCSSEYSHMHPPGSAVLQPPPDNVTVAQLSPERERRNSYQWMSKTAQSSSTGEIIISNTKSYYSRNWGTGLGFWPVWYWVGILRLHEVNLLNKQTKKRRIFCWNKIHKKSSETGKEKECLVLWELFCELYVKTNIGLKCCPN